MHAAWHCRASIARSKDIPLSVVGEGMDYDSEETTRSYKQYSTLLFFQGVIFFYFHEGEKSFSAER